MYGHFLRRAGLPSLAALVGGGLAGVLIRLLAFWTSIQVERLVAALLNFALGLEPLKPLLDPVYTRAAVRLLADVRLDGLAVGGPLGSALHARLPWLVLDPGRADHGLVRLVVGPGSPVFGRLAATALAHAAVLAIGLQLVRAGRQRRQAWLVVAGVATQLPVVISVLGARPSLGELESSGLDFAANALLPWLALRGAALSDLATGAAQPLVVATLVGLALLVSYIPGSLLLMLGGRPRAASLGVASMVVLGSSASAGALPVVSDQEPPVALVVPASRQPAVGVRACAGHRGGA
jgi:hypothetical protein